MKDIMLDLETMGTSSQAAIIAIGAVEFNIQSGEIGEKFYAVVDLESSVEAGGVIDTSTIIWWLQQSDVAKGYITKRGEPINLVLQQFSDWMSHICSLGGECVWGNGAGFDNVILSSAYKRSKIEQPWRFSGDRCYRTIKAQYPEIKMQRIGTYHNAVDDAESQARHLIAMLKPN